jgi:hypothetical protein
MGSDITLNVANIEVRQNASIQFSDVWVQSRISIGSCDQLQVSGRIRFSKITVQCKRILIAASASVEASSQGSWGGTGVGAGLSSQNGGVGGAYGGQGADSSLLVSLNGIKMNTVSMLTSSVYIHTYNYLLQRATRASQQIFLAGICACRRHRTKRGISAPPFPLNCGSWMSLAGSSWCISRTELLHDPVINNK